MKRLLILAVTLTAALSAVIGASAPLASATPTCTATGFYHDGMNLTAAVFNPANPVTGVVDAASYATPCNIGVYYGPGQSGTVDGATVENANYYGIVNNSGNVTVTNSMVTNIGENPFNGTQHGVAVFYTTLGGDAAGINNNVTTGPAATGTLRGNSITQYQKGGVVVNGPGAAAVVKDNTVTGNGPVLYIAQNGIEIARGATGSVSANNVSGNEYTGPNDASSGGILVVGGPYYGYAFSSGISIGNNTVTNNDVGVWLFNAEADGSTPLMPTKNSVVNNKISKTDGLTNVTGYGTATCGYQAGVADQGNKDNIVNNKVSGGGYVPSMTCPSSTAVTFAYDFTGSANNHVNHNTPTP